MDLEHAGLVPSPDMVSQEQCDVGQRAKPPDPLWHRLYDKGSLEGLL